ncbi:1-acyl-sn-glycerol-3-phosphate acyltransferase [Aurantivibrio plasticivorans]
MSQFDDIRPYYDEEVRPTVSRLLSNPNFRNAITRLTFPKLSQVIPFLVRPVVMWFVKRQLKDVNDIHGMQMVVKSHMQRMMDRTMKGFSCSGLEKLDTNKSYLFVSNHRDIAMDPGFVQWALHHSGHDTPRLAIGDNLLTMEYASDLMRLNKSFIVNRSATGNKEKFRALKHLSAYLHHSICEEHSSCWIAQRQGRAKDGLDRTEAAVIKMFAMNKPKAQTFAEYIRELHIVPVSISYEWDPLDEAKALELFTQQNECSYQKGEHEDVMNIARGIDGTKGHVHVTFGEEMSGEFDDADAFAAELDRQIITNYVLQPTNCIAYRSIYGRDPDVLVGTNRRPYNADDYKTDAHIFSERLRAMDPKLRHIVRQMYANPVVSMLEYQEVGDSN